MSREQRIYGWDVEAVEWDKPVLAVVASSDGGETVFKGPKCLEGVAEHMHKYPGTYVAHYGGGYDVPLLMNVVGFPEIVLSGTNILCARDGRLSLRDTFPWWLASLKKVGEAVGLEKLEADRGDVGGMSERDLVDYCIRDVRVLLAGVEACNAFLDAHEAGRRWTAGSSAVSLMRALEKGSWKALTANRNRVEDVMAFLDDAAGRGGRTECFARGVIDGVTSLDFKSSYPARYVSSDVGYGMQEATSADPIDGGVWFCRWFWPHRQKIAPALDFASSCGYGHGEGWLVGEEVRLFERHGVRVERVRGWRPQESGPVGQVFAKVMFAAKESGGAARFFSKVFLNGWIGKTLEHPVKEHFTRWRPREGTYVEALGVDVIGDRERRPDAFWFRYNTIEVGDDGRCEPHQQPLLGETVLGRARAALYAEAFAAFEEAGVPVLYCDTDSCHVVATEARCREILGGKIGDSIGQLSVEATGCRGYYLGPKAYLLVDGDGAVKKSALKGIPLRSYAKGTVDADGLFREARKGEAARDVRIELFERALRGDASRCLKDGVSTFLCGAHGFVGADGQRTSSLWGRAPQVRIVRPSGRGKGFAVETSDANAWRYVSSLESVALAALGRIIDDGGMRPKAWEALPESARAYLCDERAVELVEAESLGPVGDRGAAWRALLVANDAESHDAAANLDAWYQAGLSRRPKSHERGFRHATKSARSWEDVTAILPAIAEALGIETARLPVDAELRVDYHVEPGPQALRLLREAGEPWARKRSA